MRYVPQSQRKPIGYPHALQSFLGYLEGTEKSANTISSYRLDLKSFQEFLEKTLAPKPVALSKVTREDLENYQAYLKQKGFKSSTRRRMALTVKKLLRYLNQRNQIRLDAGKKLPTPDKLERVPVTVAAQDLIAAIRALPVGDVSGDALGLRNRTLLWALAETGCQVSELGRVRFENWTLGPGKRAKLVIGTKNQREVAVSESLYQAIEELRAQKIHEKSKEGSYVFQGFNKHGSLKSPISSRAIQLLVQSYAARLGFPNLTPRTFRHSAVIQWYREGLERPEIQKRLGLRTPYSFRIYDPIFKSIDETKPKSRGVGPGSEWPNKPGKNK